MLVDENRARFDGTLYAEPVLAAPELSSNWIVALSEEAVELPKGVKSIRLNVVQALVELEAKGIDKFTRDEVRPYRALFGMEERPALLIDDLPVNFANRGDAGDKKSRVFLMAPAGGGRVWAGNAHTAIEEALAGSQLARKIQKLERTKLPERHLFVWIGVSLFEANFGIASEDKPADAAPTVPSGITHLWAAAEGPAGPVVWRSSGEPWVRDVVDRDRVLHLYRGAAAEE
jgi:hypothetical protein